MAIKITQIKPEGAQKSAPSAKDYSGEKKGSSGSAVSGSSGRIQITKIPGAEKRRSIAASRKTTRETEHADELDKQTAPSASRQASKQTFGQRVLKGIESGLVAEGANLANLGGVAADRRGGTEMSAVYRRQAETLDKQIAALEKSLKDPTMTAQDIRETNEALAIARSEREKYGKVIESGEKAALGLYDTADKGYSLAEKWGEESTAGTKGIEKGALKIVPAATQIGLQVAERAIAPGFDVAGRALSAAGANAADYRHKAGEQYDKEKAALRATVSALGVAAGGALSKGVNAAGLKLLRTAGKQNHILPNVLLGGANAVGYAAGETGASELSKAMTEEDYTPDWNAIGQTAMTAFAFGAITSAINAAAMTGRNKRYMNELNDAVKERYDYAKRIIEDPRATAGQKAAGAESVMNAADKMRGALDELQVVGAQKEVDAMREFLLSIYGEMMPYTGAGSAGAGTAGIAPVTPGGGIMTVRPGEGANPMQEAVPSAPITPRAAGAAAAAQNSVPAQPAAAQEGAQGVGEGNLAPVPQSAAQGAQEASTSVDTNPKNHTPEEQKREESAFMSKEKGSTGAVLNMENISPQVTPEAPQRANASFDNTVPQESGGVKAQEGAESAQTAQADNTTTAGGTNHGGQEVQNHAGGAEFAEAGERTDLSNGNGRRGTGSSAREQIGGVGGSGSQRTAEQSRTALERQNHARNLRLEPISSAELGVRAGTDTKSVTVLPKSAWDARLQETAQRIRRETGKTPVFVLGSIPVRGSDRVMRVRGVWAGGQIIVQADHMNVSPEQIASHEIFHEYADQNPGLIQAVERSIREKFGDKEFDRIVESYIRNLRGIIDIDEDAADYEVEQALLDVKNEILADAYADINAFGEKAGKYQENVRQTLEERGIVDTGRETAAATERRTGPPERFSVEKTDDGRAVAVVDDDILSGIDTQTWDKTKKAQAKAAAKAALLTFKDGIQVNGIDYKVNRTSRREYTRSEDTERLYRKDKAAFADKMRAAANADDIITATTDWTRDGTLTHPRTDSFVDFAHGDVLIQSGNNQYDARVVVGITSGGEYVFYDVVDMEPTSFAKKEETPTTALSNKALGDIHGASLDDSISKGNGNVKYSAFNEEVARQLAGEDREKQRYSAESDEFYERLDEELADRAAEQDRKEAREKGIAAYSEPTIAKKELQKAILNIFSVPAQERDALRTVVDQYADSVIKNGRLTNRERNAFFNKMYESGIIKTTADEAMQATGQYVAHRKVYVPENVKALFGQDWNGFRKRAYAAGVYLTNDKSAIGVDAFNAELSEQLPTIFNKTETDGRRVLEHIVQLAEEGQAERMSLSDYIAEVAGKNPAYADRLVDGLEAKMDQALKTFAEKAGLETKLRSQSLRQQLAERDRRIEAAQKRRENRELREMQQKTLKQLQWLSKNRNRAPEAMKKAWDEALGDIDIYAARAADEMHWSKRYEATWGDLRDMYLEAKKGAENGDPKYANFLPSKELERIVDRLDKDKIADMDIDALKDLYKAAVGLRTEFYNRNKVLNDEADRLFQEVYTDATRELRSAPSGGKDKSKSGGLLDELINNQQLSPMNIIQRMGGWNPNGTLYSMAKQLESGERNVRDYTVKANRLLENFLNEHRDWVKKADGQGKDAIWYELEVPELIKLGNGDKPIFGETVKVYMTPAQKVHLYLESKNYDNLLHMTGGRTFVDKELYSKGKRREALERGTTIKLAPESVQKIVSDLTPEEAELARILKGYYNDFAPKEINKVSNVLLGYDKAITKNYAPIYTNQNYTKSEFGVFDMTAEGVGNLKERKRSTTPSYNISAFDAFEKHVDQTARYTGMAIPTRNMSTLMSWRGEHDSMQDVLAHEWGGKANEYIKDLVIEMQGGKSEKSTVAEIIPEKVFSNYISSVFGFNPSIVLKQLGSIPMGSAYLGAKNFPSVKQIHHIDKALISKYTQELAWRTMGYSMPETKQLKDNPNWTETNRVVNTIFGGGAITAMDGWAASILWPQAENKVRREHPELKIGTAEQVENGESPFYQEVAREFNDAVARSQSTSDIIHQSTLRRSKNPVARAFTLFKSDSAQTYNAIRQKYGEWQYYKRSGASEETLKKAKRGIGEAVLAALVNAVWSGTVTFLVAAVRNGAKRYRDDDDELTIESVLKEFGMGLVGDLAGVMAGGEELADIIGNGITGEKWYRIEAPGLEQMDDLIEGINERLGSFFEHAGELHNIIQNKGDVGEFLHREGRDIAGWIREVAKDAATYLPGVPANNIEAYLLGTVRTLSPELAAAYEDAFMRVEKSDLKHQHGRTLTAKVRDLLKDRTGKDSKEAAGVIASLYDSGHTDAVPTATPSYVTIDKVKHELNAYQTQVYEKAWRKAISGELDEMVQLPVFRRASEEMREKMLDKLYSYASDMAKAAVFDDYEPRTSTQTMSENAKHGLTVAVQIVGEVGKENDPKGLSLPTP